MPLENLHQLSKSAWALWKITEDEAELANEIPFEKIPANITNPSKRLEYISVRMLLAQLLETWGCNYRGIYKDEFGKPFLHEYPFQISLSHSYPYVAAVIHRSGNVGIDLEQPKPKLLRIAPRVLHTTELADASDNLSKHCIYWCAKEALVKIHGKKDLVFAENLRIEPFSMKNDGQIVGKIIVDSTVTTIPLQYFIESNFVVVLNAE